MDSVLILMFSTILVIAIGLIVVMGVSRRGGKQLDRSKYQRDWLTIEQSVTKDQSTQQFAVLQADKLLDRALRERGFAGSTMGERMTSASRVFTRREMVWASHKLRNRIAHEDSVQLSSKLTQRALNSFKRALKDLGAL